MMKSSSGRTEWAYNSQAVVDDKNQIIVAADVSTAAVDDHNLVSMIEQSEKEVGLPQRILTDACYGHSESELAKAQEAGYPVITARPRAEDDPYHPSKFSFDREARTLVCPQGHSLGSNGSEAGPNGRILSFVCKQWRTCPVREACCRKGKSGQLQRRRVRIGPHFEAAQQQRQAMLPEKRKLLMHRRLAIVEPCFARIKWLEDFRRFSFRGVDKVRTQWKMMTLMLNLRTLMKKHHAGLPILTALPAAARSQTAFFGQILVPTRHVRPHEIPRLLPGHPA
jgi:Transposase DDE domain